MSELPRVQCGSSPGKPSSRVWGGRPPATAWPPGSATPLAASCLPLEGFPLHHVLLAWLSSHLRARALWSPTRLCTLPGRGCISHCHAWHRGGTQQRPVVPGAASFSLPQPSCPSGSSCWPGVGTQLPPLQPRWPLAVWLQGTTGGEGWSEMAILAFWEL